MLIPAYADEYTGTCGGNLNWSLSGGKLTITGSGDMTDFTEQQMAPWYEMAGEITTVSLPEGLTSIGNLAFYGCEKLMGIRIPNSVATIGDYAFAECGELRTANLGAGLTTIGEGAFQQCEALTAVSFPSSVTDIGAKAFYRCYGLSAVTVPATVTYMGTSVFAYCTGLVRAVINVPMNALPSWTFYGCTSLTDVSLGAKIKTTGEYAFQGCPGLNAVYTQSGSSETAYEMEQTIGQENADFANSGFVADYDMPNSSVSVSNTDTESIQTSVTQSENAVIAVETVTDANGETKTTVNATVSNSEGFAEVAAVTKDIAQDEQKLPVNIQLQDTTIDASDMAQFDGQNVSVNITDSNGTQCAVDMAATDAGSFSGSYNLNVDVTKVDPADTTIPSDSVYKVGFAQDRDFNATVGIPVDVGNAYQYATLYQKNGSDYDAIQTVVVDNNGTAWFALANVDERTDYYVAINAQDVDSFDAVIPASLYDEYAVDSHLMDADGVTYQITGRSSRWGITGKQFAIYAAIAIGVVVLLVTLTMVTLNKISKSKAKYAVAQPDDDIDLDEDAIRLQVMEEMLRETQQKE